MYDSVVSSAYIGALVMLGGFALVFLVLLVVARWKIFTKAGEAGWKSIVPIYSDYVQWKIAWKRKNLFWVMLVLFVAAGVLLSLGGYTLDSAYVHSSSTALDSSTMNYPMVGGGAVLFCVAAILELLATYKLFKSFEHGIIWMILFLFVPNIMLLVLAFGSSQYQGPQY